MMTMGIRGVDRDIWVFQVEQQNQGNAAQQQLPRNKVEVAGTRLPDCGQHDKPPVRGECFLLECSLQ